LDPIGLSLVGRFLEFTGKLFDPLTHNFPGFELNRRTRWDRKTTTGLIWVSSDSRFGQARLKDAEITQFYGYVIRQAIRDVVEGTLDHIKYLMLDHSGLITDGDNNVSFGEL
jgi:hypothetical protein